MNLEALLKMAMSQFGGGNSVAMGGLLQGLFKLFLNDSEGGFGGFLDKFRNAGLGDVVNGWMGGGSTNAISEDQVKSALGGGLLNQLAGGSGLSISSMLPMLGFLIPKLIGMLTPGGQMPTRSGLMQQMETLTNLPMLSGANAAANLAEAKKGAMSWLWPLLAGAALIAAVLLFTGKTDTTAVKEEVAAKVDEAAASVTEAAKEAVGGLGAFLKRKLPSGVELNIPENGIESHVVAFIEDAAKPVDKTTWFDFDRLLFDTAKATLQPSSQEQLKNIADILAAYPKVKLKLGGYTDNVGNKDANMKLSADRANNVMAELVKLGVAADRLSAEGYGDQFPVGDNNTEEGRAKNRRISLRVTEK